MIQTKARGETGAMMEGMVGEKGILPERSEWFRSSGIIGTAQGQVVYRRGGLHAGAFATPLCRQNAVPPQKQKVFHDQLRAELMSLFENYGILEFEGIFSKS